MNACGCKIHSEQRTQDFGLDEIRDDFFPPPTKAYTKPAQDSCEATDIPPDSIRNDIKETIAYARGYADGMEHLADLLELIAND